MFMCLSSVCHCYVEYVLIVKDVRAGAMVDCYLRFLWQTELYHAVLTGYGFTPLEIKRFITPLYIGLGIECI